MSRLSIVRHGQASLFSDNYDVLSDLGVRQGRILGDHWIGRGEHFDEVYTGTLQRQIRTAEAAGEAFHEKGLPWPDLHRDPGFNEYDADRIMDRLLPELCERDARYARLQEEFAGATAPRDRYRAFHRLLETVMAAYIEGDYDSAGFESWAEFSGRVREALRRIIDAKGSGRRVAVFTSGGPIGLSVQTALHAPDIKAAELNWRVYNASLTEFTFAPGRWSLDSFNNVGHFREPELLTYR